MKECHHTCDVLHSPYLDIPLTGENAKPFEILTSSRCQETRRGQKESSLQYSDKFSLIDNDAFKNLHNVPQNKLTILIHGGILEIQDITSFKTGVSNKHQKFIIRYEMCIGHVLKTTYTAQYCMDNDGLTRDHTTSYRTDICILLIRSP